MLIQHKKLVRIFNNIVEYKVRKIVNFVKFSSDQKKYNLLKIQDYILC